MLNLENPTSNILLCRDCKRGKFLDSKVVDTAGDNWMAPFADHLGIEPNEFKGWLPVFSGYKSCVLLVEGQIDKEYFEFIQKNKMNMESVDPNVEIVAYGGKDTLKNTLLVQFVLSKFDKFFITFDLDAESDLKGAVQRLGLIDGKNFLALGCKQPGRDAIEGLLPERILAAVNGRETSLVMSLGAPNGKDRATAKSQLKKKYLEEFKKNTDYSLDELKGLSKIVKTINARFAKSNIAVRRTQ